MSHEQKNDCSSGLCDDSLSMWRGAGVRPSILLPIIELYLRNSNNVKTKCAGVEFYFLKKELLVSVNTEMQMLPVIVQRHFHQNDNGNNHNPDKI